MQPTLCLSVVKNVFFCFGWRRVWSSFYSGGSADPCAVFCMYILQQACQGTRHIFFLISWRSNKVSFETLCEDEGLSKLKSRIRWGSSCHVISPNVFMSASKTRARLSDLEKKCPREKLPHAIFNTLPSDFFFLNCCSTIQVWTNECHAHMGQLQKWKTLSDWMLLLHYTKMLSKSPTFLTFKCLGIL